MAQWERDGSIPYFMNGLGIEVTLDWDFFLSAERMSWPKLNHPTVILHGNQDVIVPIENSRKVSEEGDFVVSLIEIDDGHRMQESLTLFTKAAKILELN